ncbi:hypothetical protein C486_07259 [Natrinema gari JCM 14663]|uniref:Uncharacterized protein n=1 Tax=Natrinema gari JCM 14663 TaxID=1230459 RepID=L9Z420_9EURY|nr:hypothetical protein C486_07259 [Natrinema gari JCM 14663]
MTAATSARRRVLDGYVGDRGRKLRLAEYMLNDTEKYVYDVVTVGR